MNRSSDKDRSEPSSAKCENDDDNQCQMIVDNSESVLKVIKNLYTEQQMCDVYLEVGKKKHAAHRLILCASSDVFQAMLMRPEWNEWRESKVVLQELPECESVFHHFLEYLYTGKILITHTNAMPILALADKYMVKGLTRLCLDYMSRHIVHAACYNQLFSWLQYTVLCGHVVVAKHCRNYIKWNFESIANSSDFSNFEVDMLIDLLKENDVVVHNEMVLFNCIVRWLDLQKINLQQSGKTKEELCTHMNNLVELIMGYIRFPMMTPRELADLLLSPLIKEHKEFFVNRMAFGMTYHSGHEERMLALCANEEDKLQFIPRMYTSDSYSATLQVDNIHSLPSYHSSTFVFSSHLSSAEYEEKIIEWIVDFYPKGVWFQKCNLIIWQGTVEVPEEIIRTVRLSLTCHELIEENLRVHIAILIYGQTNGSEYVMEVVERVHHFNSRNRILNIDDLIQFEELNPPFSLTGGQRSSYLIGPNQNQVKLNIIITPTTTFCNKNVTNP